VLSTVIPLLPIVSGANATDGRGIEKTNPHGCLFAHIFANAISQRRRFLRRRS
jgi:hypothetical protein